MSDEPLIIGVALLIVGFVLNVASPYASPSLGANVGLWGGFFVIIGLIIIGFRLRAMMIR